MKPLTLLTLLLFSLAVKGQDKTDRFINLNSKGIAIAEPKTVSGIVSPGYVTRDTSAVWMLVTFEATEGIAAAQVFQQKGYIIRESWQGFTYSMPSLMPSTYLHADRKTPMPKDAIVWMSVGRKEDCKCD